MNLQTFLDQGGTLVVDPYESSLTPDELLAKYGNLIDSICIVAKSEAGSAYFPSNTAPKDSRYGDLFSSFSQITSDIGIQTYGLLYGNVDGFFSRDPNFLMKRSGGDPIPNYVCPNQETYWAYLGEIAAEITNKSSVDGLILKDTLYPVEASCFCDNCKRTFSVEQNIDRDFSIEQVKKSPVYSKWLESRTNSLKGLISSVVNRVHQEKKIEVIPEIFLDPATKFFEGAAKINGLDMNIISQITSHVILNIYPWTDFPTTENELQDFYNHLFPVIERLNSINTSLFLWEPTEYSFSIANNIKESLGSKNIFFTESKPPSYLDRRSLHLELGV